MLRVSGTSSLEFSLTREEKGWITFSAGRTSARQRETLSPFGTLVFLPNLLAVGGHAPRYLSSEGIHRFLWYGGGIVMVTGSFRQQG